MLQDERHLGKQAMVKSVRRAGTGDGQMGRYFDSVLLSPCVTITVTGTVSIKVFD